MNQSKEPAPKISETALRLVELSAAAVNLATNIESKIMPLAPSEETVDNGVNNLGDALGKTEKNLLAVLNRLEEINARL